MSPPIKIPDEEAYLGYALIDIVIPNDGGSGPSLASSPFQRELSKKQLKKLELVAGADGTGWRTRDFENAVYIAVDPALLDPTSLTQNPYGPYQRVKWAPGAQNGKMSLVAGAHRQSVSIKLVEPQTRSILKAQQLMSKLDPVLRADAIALHQRHIEKCMLASEPRRVWLAMLYDNGKPLPTLSKMTSNANSQKNYSLYNPMQR